ncbi:MAG: hypothetical protein IPM77_07905 [Crocinitomicaceae bacterium]|nr:hypothetical protein [Crocinitomicaceae bacterium]
MKSFAQKINPVIATNTEEILNILQPVCGLISLYNGPSLLQAEWKDNENGKRKNALAGGYAFVLQTNKGQTEIVFEYFHHGEIQLRMKFNSDGNVNTEMTDSISALVEMDLRKRLIACAVKPDFVQTPQQDSSVPQSDIKTSVQAQTINENETEKIHVELKKSSVDLDVFLPAMNRIIKDFTQGLSPEFSKDDVIYRTLQSRPESISFFTKTKDEFCVDLSDRKWDSGSHSYPDGFEFQFTLSHEKSGKLVEVRREGDKLIFITSFEDKGRFALNVKLEMEGKM